VLRLWDGQVRATIQYPAWESGISLNHNFQTRSEDHAVTRAMIIWGPFQGLKRYQGSTEWQVYIYVLSQTTLSYIY